jgi:pimeloyl-ACP methyl ester carboxylesterase
MFQETTFDADGVRLNVAAGPDGGPPLVLLHGVTRRWQDFASLAPLLTARWSVLGVDLRGHGRSGRAEHYRVVDYVDDVVRLVAAQRGRVVVFGHSLGALVAAGVAAAAPEHVAAAVLEDPPLESVGPGIRQTIFFAMFQAFAELAGSDRPVAEIAAALGNISISLPGKTLRPRLGELRDAAGLRFMASCLKQVDPAVMRPLIAGQWLDGFDVPTVLARIRCPVLLLQGEYALGGMLDDDAARRAAATIADCTHFRVPGAGHLIHTMQREATIRLVTDFLESLRDD